MPGLARAVVAVYERNINAWIDNASPADIDTGLAWYTDSREYWRATGRETGTPWRTVAAVVAVLSSQTSWPENKVHARLVIDQHRGGRDGRPDGCGGYPANLDKAYRILRSSDAGETVRVCDARAVSSKGTGRVVNCAGSHCDYAHVHGAKHAPFFWSITGERVDCPTVDVWATRIATVHPSEAAGLGSDDPRRRGLPGTAGDQIQDAYRRVAAARGWLPVQAQAVPWSTIQRLWLRADGARNGIRTDASIAAAH